jgi:hypothetical protein
MYGFSGDDDDESLESMRERAQSARVSECENEATARPILARADGGDARREYASVRAPKGSSHGCPKALGTAQDSPTSTLPPPLTPRNEFGWWQMDTNPRTTRC